MAVRSAMVPAQSTGSEVRAALRSRRRGQNAIETGFLSPATDPVIGRVFLAKPAFPADGRLLLGGGVVDGVTATASVLRKTNDRVILSIRPNAGNVGYSDASIVDVQGQGDGDPSSPFSFDGRRVCVRWADVGGGSWRMDIIETGF